MIPTFVLTKKVASFPQFRPVLPVQQHLGASGLGTGSESEHCTTGTGWGPWKVVFSDADGKRKTNASSEDTRTNMGK